jgi:hypothetical protein
MSFIRLVSLCLLFTGYIFGQSLKVDAKYGDIPPVFEENRGQVNEEARYFLRAKNLNLFVTKTGAMLALRRGEQAAAVRMEVVGATGEGVAAGEEATGGASNYFVGSDPSKWVRGARQFAKVRVSEVRSGVDLLCYANGKQFEYDLVVKPGTRAEDVRLRFAGAERIAVNADGDLRIETAAGEMVQHKPRVWQEVGGEKKQVAGRYRVLRGDEVAVVLGKYDRAREVVIDPVLSYSTYLGGTFDDRATAIAVDSAGNAYVTGIGTSSNFPTTVGAYNVSVSTGSIFVSKLNPTGTGLVYSTYVGDALTFGLGQLTFAMGPSIAIDSSGNAYIAGNTASTFYPITTGAFQATLRTSGSTGFVTKLNSTGTALLYSTYLGGAVSTTVTGIQVDGNGNAYVAGTTNSGDFPTTAGAYMPKIPGSQAAFVTKLNTGGTGLVYSTFLGGSYSTSGNAIALNGANQVWIAGSTTSLNFPTTTGAYQPMIRSTSGFDGFVSKLSADGSSLIASTYLGGPVGPTQISDGSACTSIAIDSNDNPYVTGYTTSPLFPTTAGAYATTISSTYLGDPLLFVTKLNSNLTALSYSSYLAPGAVSNPTSGAEIAVDGSGDAFITGTTDVAAFPATNGSIGYLDNGKGAFLTEFNPTGTSLLYSTFLGGLGGAFAAGIAAGSNQTIYITGYAGSADAPFTPGALQTQIGSFSGGGATYNGFVTKFDLSSTTSCVAALSPSSYTAPASGGTFSFSITVPQGCPWVVNNQYLPWLTLDSPRQGSGNGTVTLIVSPNSDSVSRSASLAIGSSGFAFAISQPAACSPVVLSPMSASFGSGPGTGQITVTASCPYTAISSAPWLKITAGTNSYSGNQISYSVDTNSFANRTATITLAGTTFPVFQTGGGCTATATVNADTGAAGGTGIVNVTTVGNSCLWYPSTTVPWIQIRVVSGTGSGAFGFTLAPNPGTTSRTGQIQVAGQTLTLQQAAGPVGTPPAYALSTIAGNGTLGFSGDGGPATYAALAGPAGLAYDTSGNLFIADQVNNRVRKVGLDGTISTVAGNGAALDSGDGGYATAAGVYLPSAVAIGPQGDLFVAELNFSEANVRRVTNGIIQTIGPGLVGNSIAVDPLGNVYVGGAGNIHEVTAGGLVSQVAGGYSLGYSGDGGSPNSALLSNVGGLAWANSSLYVADSGNNLIRALTGPGLNTINSVGAVTQPGGIAFDPSGNLVFTSSSGPALGRFVPGGSISIIVGYSSGAVPAFASLQGLAIDPFGNIAVSDPVNNVVDLLTPTYNFCSYVVPVVPPTVAASGATISFSVTTSTGCVWDSYSTVPWITISNPSGSGSGAVQLVIAPTDTSETRTAWVSVANESILVTQLGSTAIPSVFIDFPGANATLSGTVGISGWALENIAGVGPGSISGVYIFVDGAQVGTAVYGVPRPDVCNAYPGRLGCPNVGWSYNLNLSALPGGTHSLRVEAVDNLGNNSTNVLNFNVVQTPPSVVIDGPAAGATLTGRAVVSGWAIESIGSVGPSAVSSVAVLVDGVPMGTATYGIARPDVCAAFPGRVGCPNVGWSYNLNVAVLAPGSHTLTVAATDAAGNSSSAQVTFIAGVIPPSINIESPVANATLNGTVAIGGWAIENTGLVGPAAVSSVAIFVDGNMAGYALYGLSRPDVCAAFPGRLGCPNVGWTYNLNVSSLTVGTHTLKVVATDTLGNSSFSQVSFNASGPPPSVYIESPVPNATLTGMATIGGWALENTGTVGPSAVSSVTVFVDGLQVGTAVYGLSRPDVCGVFPGRLGCPNVGWIYSLNIATLTAGSHVLKVVATDGSGNASFSQVGFIAHPQPSPSIYIESPVPNSTLSGTVTIGGWAIENTSTVGPAAVASVTVAVDGTQVGTAVYGLARPDVCGVFPGRLGCPNVGWIYSLNVSGLAAGGHTLKVTAIDSSQNSTSSQVAFVK